MEPGASDIMSPRWLADDPFVMLVYGYVRSYRPNVYQA